MLFGMNAYVEKFKSMETSVQNQNALTTEMCLKSKGVNNSLLSIYEDMKEMRKSLSMIDPSAETREDRFKKSSGLSSPSPVSSIPFKVSDDKGGEKAKSQVSQGGEKAAQSKRKEQASTEEETSPSGRSRTRSAKRA